MVTGTVDQSQRTAARIAGIAYPLSFATVVWANFGVFGRLIARGNPEQTVRNIVANERLFRIGIIGDLLYCVGVVVVLTALYVVLRPVSRNLALLAAVGRFIHALTWIYVSLHLFTVLRIVGDASYARAFSPAPMALFELGLSLWLVFRGLPK